MILRIFLVKPVFCSGLLLCLLSLLLVTCAPLPKEGESRQQAEVTLTLQHRADRLARSDTASRLTEFIVVVPGGTAFSEQGPSNFVSYGILDLQFNQITLSLNLDTSLQLFIYRYADALTSSDLQAMLADQALDQGAIDFGLTNVFSIPVGSTTTQLNLTVQLQREVLFLDAAVEGLSYTTGGSTFTTNQDGLLYYFPDNLVSLSLGNLPLGNFTQPPAVLTPYSLFEVTEGESDDRVTNFARLLQSMDRDTDPQNGIQLDASVIAGLNPNLNFGDNSSVALNGTSFDQLAVPADRALRHLAGTMRLKNLGALKPFTTIPAQNEDHASPSGLIGVAFNENLRASTIGPASFLLSDSNGSPVSGTLSTERNWLLFKPTTALPQHSQFNATVSRGLLTQTGRSLEADFSWSFTTGDLHGSLFPNLVHQLPDNGSAGAPTNTPISLTFDGPLFLGSQGIRWEVISDNGSSISCSHSLQPISVSCLPIQELPAQDNLTVTLLAGSLRSLEGIENDNLSWQFQTGSGPSSGVASLQHLGEFHDNVSRDRLIGLLVGEGGSQYQLGQGEAPIDNESQWRLPLFYPVQVPFELEGAEGEQTVRVWYRQDNGTPLDNRSVTVNLDYSPPIGLLTLPKATNQPTLPYLVMANDNLSGAWRYLVTRINSYPAEDLESWQDFPHSPMSLADRSQLWDNITRIDPRWECVRLEELRAFANGDPNPDNDNSDNSPACDAPGIASFDNFSSLLPAWDNQSFVFDNLSDPNPQSLVLWVQDRAGNIGWGYPFEILFDNVTPDLNQVSLLQDNGSLELSATALRLELYHSNEEIRFELLLASRDNDTAFVLAQLDNASTPVVHDQRWLPVSQQYYSVALDNTSGLQQQTLSLWLKDQAGNIAALSSRTAYWSRLYDGEERLDNQSSPTANRYAALTLKYPQTLSSSYPLEQLRVSRSSDNQTVSGQWNIDNDSLVFWMEGPLQPEQGYQLEIKGHVDNISLYASQVFHFQSDNQTLDLNQGLVAYYPLDENPPIERQSGAQGTHVGDPVPASNRFNHDNQSIEFDGSDAIKGLNSSSLPLGNSNRTLVYWHQSKNTENFPVSPVLINWGNTDDYKAFGTYIQSSSAKISFYGNGTDYGDFITENLITDKWEHWSVIYNDNILKLYKNGELVSEKNYSNQNLNTQSVYPITFGNKIGFDSKSFNNWFIGKLDDVRIYDRVLSTNEIKALYAVADPNPPEITSSTPANNATGFSVADNLTITFDKPLDGSTIQASSVELRRSDNTTVAGNLYLDPNDNRSLIFDPIDNLSSLTNYTLYLHSSIRDFIGNSISPTQIPFQTQMLGGGTTDQPYLIGNPEGLAKINDNLTANYRLSNDIHLVEPWVPLNNFTGILYGDNHTISNLQISSSTNYVGLFSKMDSAQVFDLKLDTISLQAPCSSYVGSLVGEMTASTIQNVHARNILINGGPNTGGLIGAINTGNTSTIERSSAEFGKVDSSCLSATGGSNVGGLIGAVYESSTITESYADVEVLSNYASTGGLIGGITNAIVEVSESYALGSVISSKQNTGGLIGHLGGQNIIENSFSSNRVTSSNASYLGGLIGVAHNTNTFNNSYYDKDRSGQADTGKGQGRTPDQLVKSLTAGATIDGVQTYTGWDFVNVWDAGSACDYPRLRWQNEPLQVSCVLHDGSDNATTASRSAEIQIGFNRPVDNSTLTSGGSVKFVPPIGLDNFSYDNTSQILTLQPAEPLVAGTVYTIQFQNIRSADQQSIIDNFTHTFTTSQLGATWIQATANADFPPVNAARLETFQDKLWLLGGNDPSVSNQVWTSENGKDWTQAITSTQTDAMWGVRNTHASATFQDKLWVLGGNSGTAANPNPIWSSVDGLTWAKTENVNWSQRWRNSTVVFNDRIWVIGGYNNGWKNDAWSSVDGTNWSQESSQVWSTSGAESTAVVFDGKIWMLGGWDAGGLINTIRNSTDGKTWQTVTPQVPIWESRWDHQAIVFDNKIWVLGGEERGPNTNHNDVWYSTDGINWVEVTPSANWSVRSRFTSTIFENKIWIATGDNGAGQRFNDVWYTEGSGLIVASMRDNATDVSLTPELWMRLSYPVQPTSVESTNFFLQFDNGTLVSGTSLLDPDNTTVRFIPDGPLEANSHYSLIASTGLKRQSDNKSVFQSNRLLRFTTHPDLDTDPALVLHLSFTGNTNDLSAQQNDGTNYSATLSSDRFGNLGSAYSFNGNSYIEIPDDNSLDFWPNQNFTIHFWLKTDNCTSSSSLDVDLISKWDTAGTSNYPYSVRCSQDGSIIGIKYVSGIANPYVQSVNKVKDDNYHAVSFVSDGNTLKLFIDGKIDSSASFSLAPNIQNNSSLFIGKRSSSNTNNFTGILDDIRIYNRALSDQEISSLSKEISRGLVSSYSMNHLDDLVGNNHLLVEDGEHSLTQNRYNNLEASLFDGDDALRSANLLSSTVAGSNPRTLVYWQRLDQLNGSYQHVVSWGGETAQPFGSYINVTDGRFGYWNGSANLLTSHVPPLGQWQQWALTYHSNGLNEVFLNGNLIASKTQTLNTTPGKLYLGKKPVGIDSTPYYFQGALDEILIYDRVLSASEIKALQNVRDLLAPMVGSVLINNGADNTSIDSLTLALSSRDASPIVAYQITDNGSFAGLPWRSDNLTPSDNVSFQTSYTLGSSDFGERQVEVRFKDEAGNISKPFSDNITRLDTTPPQPLSFSLLGTADNDNFSKWGNVSFIGNATDDVAPVGMYLSENSTTPLDNASGWQAYANTGTFNLSAGQGEKQVYLWFKDAANNISSYLTDTITLDNVSPTANGILINSGADNTTSSTVILSFDNVTGASHYFATDDASAPTPAATAQGWKLYPANASDNFTLTGTGNREVRVWFRDDAGNVSRSYSDNISWFVIEVSYSENFTSGTLSSSSSQCTNWNYFRDSLNGNYSSIRINGSNDSIGKICSGSAATELCNALKSGTPTSVECSGTTWRVGTCGSGIELSTSTSSICGCDAAFTVRPCIGNQNWGGIGATCDSNTQSLSVVCSQ